jgi:hypothetical protein
VARLTAAERKRIPTKEFAGKGRSYPIPDKGHAKAAIVRAKEYHPADEATIIRRARKKLGKTRGGKAEGLRSNPRADKPKRGRGGLTKASNVKGHDSTPFTNVETDRRRGYTTDT